MEWKEISNRIDIISLNKSSFTAMLLIFDIFHSFCQLALNWIKLLTVFIGITHFQCFKVFENILHATLFFISDFYLFIFVLAIECYQRIHLLVMLLYGRSKTDVHIHNTHITYTIFPSIFLYIPNVLNDMANLHCCYCYFIYWCWWR